MNNEFADTYLSRGSEIWNIDNYSDFEFNGNITVEVINENNMNISEGDQLAIFSNGECRGVVNATYCPINDKYLFPLMAYSNIQTGEDMSFSYYSSLENEIYENINTVEFEGDMIIGNALDPYIINIYDEVPNNYNLGRAYPNPFNPTTNIMFTLSDNGYTNISVYDLQGRLIDELVSGIKLAGEYEVSWNAENRSSGVYFIQMNVNGFSATQKIMLVK